MSKQRPSSKTAVTGRSAQAKAGKRTSKASRNKQVRRAGASQLTKAATPSILWQWDSAVKYHKEGQPNTNIVSKSQLDENTLLPSKILLKLSGQALCYTPTQFLEQQVDQVSARIALVGESFVAHARSQFDCLLIVADSDLEQLPPHATLNCRDLRGKKRHLWLKQSCGNGIWELFVPKSVHLSKEMLIKVTAQDKTLRRIKLRNLAVSQSASSTWQQQAVENADRVAGFQTPATWQLAEMEQALKEITASPVLAQKLWLFMIPGIPVWNQPMQRFSRALAKLPGASLGFDYERMLPGSDFMPSGPTAAITLNGLRQLELPLLHAVTADHARDLMQNIESLAHWQNSADGFIAIGGADHPMIVHYSAAKTPKSKRNIEPAQHKQ